MSDAHSDKEAWRTRLALERDQIVADGAALVEALAEFEAMDPGATVAVTDLLQMIEVYGHGVAVHAERLRREMWGS